MPETHVSRSRTDRENDIVVLRDKVSELRAAEGVKRATVLVGPALILTSLVLACGLSVTIFSDLPSQQLFGWLSGFTLIAALVGDLLILPATMVFLRRLVIAVRRGRMDRVAELVEGINADELNRQVASPNGGTTAVMSCLHLVFRDEWWHDQYANRDLAILERGE